MQYCAKRLYPANAKPTIIFDEDAFEKGNITKAEVLDD